MAQVRLNLQPPPNVDFVTGYPGIPPGPDRPQASVKGAIEVRVPPSGVKAKWVRIELRKVETLPGAGVGSTYYDYVGPSPVNLWSTSDEYGHLRSQDFPFSIRIPESIPPTIALDNRAEIGYELLASVCTKGKRGFLRKAKSVVVSVTAPVIIDKHELHSTWPVYCQPETRHLAQDDVNLVVERNRTCFGPGDRISVVATVKSDSLNTVILRGFEIVLKEATIFRPGIAPGKKVAPLVNQIMISENKVAVNATLYGGTSHMSELACMVPVNHTTPTLTSARHIDVTYTLSVRALMGTGTHLVLDLPIVMSNWQRDVSFEAISRIGPAPGLSLLPQGSSSIPGNRVDRGRPADAVAVTLPSNRANVDNSQSPPPSDTPNAFNTAPASTPVNPTTDEFGTIPPMLSQNSTDLRHAATTPAASTGRTTSLTGGGNRYTVTNALDDLPSMSTSGTTAVRQWPTAEDEKAQLYEKAIQRVAKVQGPVPVVVAAPANPPLTKTSSPPPTTQVSQLPNNKWLSAEEEKAHLFEKAQAAVAKTQGPLVVSTPALAAQPSDSTPKPSAAAALYAEAISSQTRSGRGTTQPGITQPGSSSTTPIPKTGATVPYLTAEQEKAALRRYEDAKRAVDRTQNVNRSDSVGGSNSGPIAYESLFPTGSLQLPPPRDEGPPPFDNAVAGSSNIMAQLSEKERLRREYEARDATALAKQNHVLPQAVYTSPPPSAPGPSTPVPYANAFEEKEALRKRFAARDAQTTVRSNGPPQPPPRANGISDSEGRTSPSRSPGSATGGFRPTPVPPASGSGTGRVLTAAEEKALLKAKFEAFDSGRKATQQPPAPVMPFSPPNGFPAPTLTPPPLMPRPPAEYIKETQEEDARLSKLNGVLNVVTPAIRSNGSPSSTPHSSQPHL